MQRTHIFCAERVLMYLPLQEAQMRTADRRGRSTQTPGVENAFLFLFFTYAVNSFSMCLKLFQRPAPHHFVVWGLKIGLFPKFTVTLRVTQGEKLEEIESTVTNHIINYNDIFVNSDSPFDPEA